MALRRLYSVAVLITPRIGGVEFICGMTVARTEEQVRDIVRMHVGPNKRFEIRALVPGDSNPAIAGNVAEILSKYGFEWLDPRPQSERTSATLEDLVPYLLTADLAL